MQEATNEPAKGATKGTEMAFTGGPHCEIWKWLWEGEGEETKDGEKVGGEGVEADDVKVSSGLVTLTPLKWPFSGGLQSISNTKNVREDV